MPIRILISLCVLSVALISGYASGPGSSQLQTALPAQQPMAGEAFDATYPPDATAPFRLRLLSPDPDPAQ